MAQKIYVGRLERFGYELISVGFTEKEARDSLEKEYVSAFKKRNNGVHPKKEICSYYSDGTKASYYEVAMEEIYVCEMEVGKVEWT